MKIALLQMHSQADGAANIRAFSELAVRAVGEEGADMVVPPEVWSHMGGSRAEKFAAADTPRQGPAYAAAQAFAARHRVWVHAGSILEKADGGKVQNVTYAFDRDGREVARYAKIHLFDIVSPNGEVYAESASVTPGREVVTYAADGLTIGCAICYDLRFPELFQALAAKGADVIALPAAFTMQTGKDHWEVLIRARAIETQCYMVAPAQIGAFTADGGDTRLTYGHTLIADPWGHVVARASDRVGVVSARIDRDYLAQCRMRMPLMRHKVIRPF